MKTFEDYLNRETYNAECRENARRRENMIRRETIEQKKNRKYKYTVTVTTICLVLLVTMCMFARCTSILVSTYEEKDVEVVEVNTDETDKFIYDNEIPATERCYMTDEEIQEDYENYYIEKALLSKANRIDNVEITHYCSELYPHICGTGDGITASGNVITPYLTVAVDPDVIPLGSEVMIDYGDGEIHYYLAQDTGGSIKGNHIDVAVSTHDEALELGKKTATVYFIPPEEQGE